MDNFNYLKKELIFFLYKKKFLFLYTLIGFTSILLELFLRSILIELDLNKFVYNFIPLFLGIFYAFYLNIKINFFVPKVFLKKSLIYFIIISLISFIVQKFLQNTQILTDYNYNIKRVFSSGLFFLIGYFLHSTFTFKKSIKVGVAIYANGFEELEIIKNKIGEFPDFIHIDIVDKTMKENADEIDFSKLDAIKRIWPGKEIHTHIMSTHPLKLIQKVIKFSKIIYVHKEVQEDLNDLRNYMLDHNVIPGIALHSKLNYANIEKDTEGFKEIMLLSIDKPGFSGQKFNQRTFELINKIDQMKNRSDINLLVDGGVNSKIIRKINCEKIVSGAAVLKSDKPITEIMKLQTVSRYEL